MFEYIKELPDGSFEVKLGAGKLPVVVSRYDLDYLSSMSSGTASIPARYHSIEHFTDMCNAVAKVLEYLHSKE